MRRIVVGRGRFALPKTHKSHIRHEPDAQLSTSDNSYQFSFGIFQISFVMSIVLNYIANICFSFLNPKFLNTY